MVSVQQGGEYVDTDGEDMSPDVSPGELLDEMLTHRGEIRHRSMSLERHNEVSIKMLTTSRECMKVCFSILRCKKNYNVIAGSARRIFEEVTRILQREHLSSS